MASHCYSHPFSFPLLPFSYLIMLLISLHMAPCVYSFDYFSSCSRPFHCGNVMNVGFPFWGDGRPKGCGYPELYLSCTASLTYLTIKDSTYLVKEVDPDSHSLKIARVEFLKGPCPDRIPSTTLDILYHNLFDYIPDYQNLTLLYGCNVTGADSNLPGPFECPLYGAADKYAYAVLDYEGPIPGYCKDSVVVPFRSTLSLHDPSYSKEIEGAVEDGFEVKWIVGIEECNQCQQSGGVCGYDLRLNQETCFCKGSDSGLRNCSLSPDSDAKARQGSGSKSAVIGIAVGVAAFVAILLAGFIFLVLRRRKRITEESKSKELFVPPSSGGGNTSTTNMSQSVPSYSTSNVESVQKSFYFGVQVFTYAELEEATDNFNPSKELGDGGFGTVYYGKLKDGRAVAVKRLYESNFKRVEQFMNEVEILAKIRHNNLVALYGCTSRHSRELLLVYEYIPNGTVADHVHGKRAKSVILPWPIRLNIAVETAQALAYLHASDVIHRDVKTNNILLDNKFRVKVADFGLSRLFPTDVTHVSTAPQGTPGYVDPEYYQCYQLTDKSDVYSFGVVLIELISSLQAVDVNRTRLDVNLANMAINKIQNHELEELVDPYLGFERDLSVRRMITSVAELAFRCLQQDRDIRPSMNEVLDVLKGIQNEEYGQQDAELVDIRTDEVIPLKNVPLPFSPDSVADNWVSCSTTSNSS